MRVYPRKNGARGELARAIAQLAARELEIEELHTEEGRLDEVFRSITCRTPTRRSGMIEAMLTAKQL